MEKHILEIINSLSAQALQYFFPGLKTEHDEQNDILECEQNDILECEQDDNLEFEQAEEIPPIQLDDVPSDDMPHTYGMYPADNIPCPEDNAPSASNHPDSGVRFSVSPKEESKAPHAKFDDIRGFFDGDGGRDMSYSPVRRHESAEIEPASRPKKLEAAKKTKEEPGLITRGKRALRKLVAEPEIVDQPLDTKAKELLKELLALQDKYGVSIEELEVLLSYTVKVSRLKITRNHKIILEDFDKIEVKMDKLTKAVFLLYLKHPEGIRYKDLGDYRDELEDIYTSISGRSDMDAIRKSISDLTDSIMSNSINEKVSKARKAFRDVIDERIARFYYIDGKQGAAKNIVLDRALVIWE
ncbi:MAG: hypothetical protein MJY67_05045 [Bacteroidales bacterium]|nr:hypothetical protein [Bacteroidales bacterium]